MRSSRAFNKNTSSSLVILYLISSVFGIATIAAGIGQHLSFFGSLDGLFVLSYRMFDVLSIIGELRMNTSFHAALLETL